jgi:hypothetical protein
MARKGWDVQKTQTLFEHGDLADVPHLQPSQAKVWRHSGSHPETVLTIRIGTAKRKRWLLRWRGPRHQRRHRVAGRVWIIPSTQKGWDVRALYTVSIFDHVTPSISTNLSFYWSKSSTWLTLAPSAVLTLTLLISFASSGAAGLSC